LDELYTGTNCLEVPEQYRDVFYDATVTPKDMVAGYATYLQSLIQDIVNTQLKHANIMLCSPAKHSKTIMAYTCIQTLFRRRVPVAPLFDVLEIKRVLRDYSCGRKTQMDIEDPTIFLKVPYLFVRVPMDTTYEVYDAIAEIVDKRTRRGHVTIFLYNGSWETLVYNDKRGTVKDLIGDGSFGTILNKTWRRIDGN